MCSYNISANDVKEVLLDGGPKISTPKPINHSVMRQFFCWLPEKHILDTFKYTSQMMRAPLSTYLRKRHRTPHPAANIIRCNDIDLMDSVFSDTPAVATGETVAQIIATRQSKFVSIHGMKDVSKDDILGAFQDCVRWRSAPKEVRSDDAAVYNGNCFTNYCCDLYISLWQSEAYHQNQNYAENVWETLKRGVNCLLDFTGAPPTWWLLGLLLLAQVWNHTVDAKLGDGTRSPYMVATGRGDDISPYICYSFYKPVYARVFDNTFFPSECKEICCQLAGVSEHVGGQMTWTLVTDKTQKIIHCSSIRSTLDPNLRNLTLDPLKSTNVKMLVSF